MRLPSNERKRIELATRRLFRENAADVETSHQLCRSLDDQGSCDDRRIRALRAGGHTTAGKPGHSRPCSCNFLVIRQHLARCIQEWSCRPQDQGALSHLRFAFGVMRILWKSKFDQGGKME